MHYVMRLTREGRHMNIPDQLSPINNNGKLISISNLAIAFSEEKNSHTVVNNISFDIAKGETFALIGESGSGKSITALSIMRLLPPNARIQKGRIDFKGKNLLRLTEAEMRLIRGRHIGIIFQEPMTSLNPVMTIGQQINEAIKNLKPESNKKNRYAEIVELLTLVGLKSPEQRIDEYPHQFSGGMRQRVMIAIALAGEPDLLIADEPTTALDVTIQAQVLALIKDIQKKRKMAVLLITHNLGIVNDFADRVAVMRHGEILEVADANTFFNKPLHEYSKNLFESIPSLSKRGKKLSTTNKSHSAITQISTHITSYKTKENSFLDAKSKDNTIAANNDPHLLTVNNLETYFPIKKGVFKKVCGYVKAVDGVSLSIKPGKTLALVGESGSGKTTLAKTIIGLIKPSKGEIIFSTKKIGTHFNKSNNFDIQIIFQDPYSSMNPRMLVRDILSEGMKALNILNSAQHREERMIELLNLVGLEKKSLNRYPHQFSGGQRQRIAIARALAVNPKLIICDEPTSALDVSVQAQILNLLKDLQQYLGVSYLFITHDISVVSYIADEVAVMLNGEIVESGQVEDIILRPCHTYTKKLMDAVPSLYKKNTE